MKFSSAGFKRYFKNTSWLMLEKMLRMGIGLFVGVWVARYLGPEKFGLINFAQSFVFLFVAFSSLGLDGIVVRELVKFPEKQDSLLGTSFYLKLAGSILVLPVIYSATFLTSNDYFTNKLIFIIAASTIFQSFNVIDVFFQAKVRSKYVVFSNILSLLLSSAAKVFLILRNGSLEAFAGVCVFEWFVIAVGNLYFYKFNRYSIMKWKFDPRLAKALLKDSWPLILSSAVVSTYMRMDQIMLKEMLGAESVGQYAAAIRFSEIWYFIPLVVSNSVQPKIVELIDNQELLEKRLLQLYAFLTWIAIGISVFIVLISEPLVNRLYGGSYNGAGTILCIHIWASLFVFLGQASGPYMVAKNYISALFFRTFYGAIACILLNYVFIKNFGLTGAAIATLLGYMVSGYLYDLFDKNLRLQFKIKTMAIFTPWKAFRK